MESKGFTTKLDAAPAMMELRNGEGELRGPQLAYAAILRVLQFAAKEPPPSPYAMACEILGVGMLVPQEAKGAYIVGLAGLYHEKDVDADEWRKFRVKLQTLLLKQQGLVQGAEMLLQDWQIDQPTLKQMDLFVQAKARSSAVDMTTGEVEPS